jgi:cytochrome c553
MIRRFIDAVVWGTILAILSRLPPPPPPREVRKRRWIDRLLELGALGGVLAIVGIVVVVGGLIPIKASSGHWPVTRWFLEFSMERSFATQSLGVEVPPLDDESLVLRGATQYETTCRPCHGAPDLRAPRVASAMTPMPPYLPEVVTNWDAAELFSITKHGVKFTGMPGWPAQKRDDEVWAMVAFLRRLPKLDAASYQQLAFGGARDADAAAPIEMLTGPENLPRAVRERCARCHGADGRGRGTAFPILAGQHEAYLYNSLRAFASGGRHSGIMEPVAAGLTDAEMHRLARYYASLPPAVGTHGAAQSGGIARGRDIAHRGIPSQRVPPCIECHGPKQPHPRRDYPMLAGQHASYLVLQLELFRGGHRGGSPYAHLMHEVAPNLTPQQIRDVAAYYDSLR